MRENTYIITMTRPRLGIMLWALARYARGTCNPLAWPDYLPKLYELSRRETFRASTFHTIDDARGMISVKARLLDVLEAMPELFPIRLAGPYPAGPEGATMFNLCSADGRFE